MIDIEYIFNIVHADRQIIITLSLQAAISVLIWIKTAWHSDSVPEKIFGKVDFEKCQMTPKHEKLPSMQRVYIYQYTHVHFQCTVNPEIFARILFSRIALKEIFAALKIRD